MVDRLLKQRGCISGSHSCVFYNTVLFFPFQRHECGHLLNIWETTEFWILLLFPGHLPVLGIVAVGSGLALIIFGISSFLIYRWVWLHPAVLPVCAAFNSNLRNLGFWWIWFFFFYSSQRKKVRKRERERHVWSRINGLCFYRCQCGIYTIVAVATAQQVMVLKQRCSVFELPSELICQPQQPVLQFSLNDH